MFVYVNGKTKLGNSFAQKLNKRKLTRTLVGEMGAVDDVVTDLALMNDGAAIG